MILDLKVLSLVPAFYDARRACYFCCILESRRDPCLNAQFIDKPVAEDPTGYQFCEQSI
jgi:hypothetical protein